jgi:Intracellular proteinase inhibitor
MNRWVVPILAVLATGCVEKATVPRVPEQILPMQLSTSLQVLERGQSTTLTVTLTNSLDVIARLTFPTSCQMILRIINSDNRLVASTDQSTCASVPSQINLPVGSSRDFEFTWSGESRLGPPGSGTPLPAGSYYASAEMNAEGYVGVAFPLKITLLN